MDGKEGISNRQKLHKCPVCRQDYVLKSNLNFHMKKFHSNECLYKCPNCSKGFNQMSALSSHQLKFHSHGQGRVEEAHKSVEKASSTKSSNTAKSTATPSDLSSGKFIVIPYVDTDAMRKVKMKDEIPFALLYTKRKDIVNNSLIVRVFDYGEKSIIREATRQDIVRMPKIAIVANIHETDAGYTVSVSPENRSEMTYSKEKVYFKSMATESEDAAGNA